MAYTDSADDDPYAALPPDPGTEPVDPTAAEQDPEFMAQLARRYRNPAAGMGVQPDAPLSAESDILPLAAGAAGTLLSHIGQGYASMGRGIGNAVSGAYGSLKEALAAYANGDNAAPPAVVDAAMQKAADKLGPNADKSKVVQAAIAGPDPLSPDYMNQAGQAALGGLGGGATTGQAPARTGYDQTTNEGRMRALTGGAASTVSPPSPDTSRIFANSAEGDYGRINPPVTQQDLIERGMTSVDAANVIAKGGMSAVVGPKVSRFLPPGFLDDPVNRATLDALTSQRGEPSMSGSGEGGRVLQPSDYLNASRETYENLADKLLSRANARAGVEKAATATSDLQQKVSTGYNPSNMQQALRMRAAGTLPSDIQRQQDMRNLTYDPTGAQEAPEPPMRSSGDGGGSTSRNTNRNTKTRAPAARGRRSDLDTGTEAPVQTAMADSGTMSDASNDIRSTVPAGAQVAAAGQTGYANQPPAPGGFSGAAGPATDVAVRPGAFTPAGAAVPAAPAAPAELPNGMKLVPTSGGQYDRAIVGSDGRVLQYIPKGQPSPSPQQAADIMSQSNTAEMENRLAHGDPTAIADLRARASGQPGVDRSKPLPPAQAATAESMAATQAEQARRTRGGFAAPAGGSGDPVQDLLARAAQTSDPNAQRMFTNEAYKIQETRRINQQKSADAALKTFSTGEQTLIKSIYTKENAGNTLTPAEQALKDDYVNRIRQHSRSQSGGQQGAAPGIRSTLQQAAGTAPQIPAAAIQDLKKNPGTRAYFDQAFGAGAAARYLGQ